MTASGRITDAILYPVVSVLQFLGEAAILLGSAIRGLFGRRFEFVETLNQMAFVGVASVPLVALATFFSGAVLSLYTTQFLSEYGADMFIGATIGLAIAREAGPVLAATMVAARAGSAMAAQIGTMAVTEQLDALKMLSVPPVRYLVIPRLIAGMIMLPVLALVGIWAGIVGGWAVAHYLGGVPSDTFLQSLRQFLEPWDIWGGIIKAPFFGVIIAIVACQQGMRTKQGAVGVGKATTNAVVISMVLIYITNLILARIIFN
jgi:phospholipid/cholesterol/gamma-HCH transport system permease protein